VREFTPGNDGELKHQASTYREIRGEP
jgi:hypothetical protein